MYKLISHIDILDMLLIIIFYYVNGFPVRWEF